jgi:hypothetical protein
MIPLPAIAPSQNDRFIILPILSAPIALAALSPSNEGLATDRLASSLPLPLPPLPPPAAAIAADLLPHYDHAAPSCLLFYFRWRGWGSAHLSLRGRSPSHSFPRGAEVRSNVVVILVLLPLLPLLSLLPLLLPSRQSAGPNVVRTRVHCPRLDVRPPQRIAAAAATAAVLVLAVTTT